MPAKKSSTRTETFEIKGSEVVAKLKELIKEGNVRKITIKDKNGKIIAEFSLTLGVVGTVIAPVLAAVGVMAALVTDCTISVEREK